MIKFSLGALVAPVLFLNLSLAQTSQATKPVVAKPVTSAPAANPALFGLSPITKPTAADLARGARVYKANCVRCHNADPNLKGSLGPEQVDAPFEVVVSKIMTGKYPEPLPKGFVPKRKTRAMTPLKNLKNDIPYIHAWIQSVKKKK